MAGSKVKKEQRESRQLENPEMGQPLQKKSDMVKDCASPATRDGFAACSQHTSELLALPTGAPAGGRSRGEDAARCFLKDIVYVTDSPRRNGLRAKGVDVCCHF